MRRKRPCDLVRAIPRVLAALPPGTPAPRFVVAGDGPMRSKVEREVARLGVTRHLELRGWMSRDQVKELLSQATVFALPSSWEALSIATLEALAAGVPAVAMSGCGVTDIIQPGREGLLGGNLDEFAACLARLISDRALRDQLAGRARAAAGRFAWSTVLQRHLEVYERVLARRRVEPSTFRPPVAA
jgi:glycosyltransferase involved in cell wall biosynthesis